jgi:hypothetical protein
MPLPRSQHPTAWVAGHVDNGQTCPGTRKGLSRSFGGGVLPVRSVRPSAAAASNRSRPIRPPFPRWLEAEEAEASEPRLGWFSHLPPFTAPLPPPKGVPSPWSPSLSRMGWYGRASFRLRLPLDLSHSCLCFVLGRCLCVLLHLVHDVVSQSVRWGDGYRRWSEGVVGLGWSFDSSVTVVMNGSSALPYLSFFRTLSPW